MTDHSLSRLRESALRSYGRLGHIDILYIHRTTLDVLRDKEVMDEMRKMRKENRYGISCIGASISRVDVLEQALEDGLLDDMDVVQIPVYIVEERPELIPRIREKGIAVIVNSPVLKAKGLSPEESLKRLANNPYVSHILTGSRNHYRDNLRAVERAAEEQVEEIIRRESVLSMISEFLLCLRSSGKDEKTIVGIDYDWIPAEQQAFVQPLISEIHRIAAKQGMGNLEIRLGRGRELAAELADICRDTSTSTDNVLVIADRRSVEARDYAALRSDDGKKGAFLIGIDAKEIESTSYIQMMDILTSALRIFSGNDPAPGSSSLVIMSEGERYYVFVPKAECYDHDILSEKYDKDRLAVRSA